MPDVVLDGCRTDPLASYLKALGLLRLVGAQLDRSATGRWHDGRFVLSSPLDLDGIVEFLADRYVPTPLVAPWNRGSGFGDPNESSSPTATAAVAAVTGSTDPRLAPYRDAIAAIDRLRARPGWYGLAKEQQVALCRNFLPDDALAWLDATVVLSGDTRAFPPLLGTGGNDGRFDFSSNYMQRVSELLGVTPRGRGAAAASDLARAALVGDRSIRNDRAAIGQFDPAAAGGPASSSFGAAEALVNPWDFVLLLEGALLFASGAARRLSTGEAAAAVPFIVAPSRAGHPSWSDAENARGELWAPVWRRPVTAPELAQLMGEGRAQFRPGKQARSGVEVVRAIAALGVDRRIEAFVRYAFVERNGLATFAVCLGTVPVRLEPAAAPLWQLDRWVRPLRTAKATPQVIGALLRRLDDAQFVAATGGGRSDDAAAVASQEVLVAVAELEHAAQRSSGLRDTVHRSVAGLKAEQWLPAMADPSYEMQIAVSLASLRTRVDGRPLLRAVLGDPEWLGTPPAVAGLFGRPLVDVLVDVLSRLAITSPHTTPEAAPRWLGGPIAVPCRLEAVEAFVRREVDDDRIRRLLAGCLLLDWRGLSPTWTDEQANDEGGVPTDPAMALLLPFFHRRDPFRGRREVTIVADRSWPNRLRRGDILSVADDARRRLMIAGMQPAMRSVQLIVGRGARLERAHRLAAACLVPLSDWGIQTLLDRAVADPIGIAVDPDEPDESDNDDMTTEEATS